MTYITAIIARTPTGSSSVSLLMAVTLLYMANVALAESPSVQPNLSSIVTGSTEVNVSVYSVSNQTEAIEIAWEHYLEGNHNSSDLFYDWETNYIIENITFPENETLSKRWDSGNAPLGTWFHQWQVAQQGTWDQQWYPASGCQYNGLGSGVYQFTQSWSQSTSWTVSAGFNFDVGKAAAFSLGASITREYQQSGSRQISIPQGSVGQTWTQKRMVWQNQQRQKCVRRDYGRNGLHCDAWSGFIHGNIPDAWAGYNVGSSIGYGHVQC